jgi:hypothetical protein
MRILLLVTMALFSAALRAGGPVYKCKTDEGKTIYQESPCAAGQQGGAKDVMPSAAAAKALPPESKTVGNPAAAGGGKTSSEKAMDEAYYSRMSKGDYDGALAFARTDEQKQRARSMKAETDRHCDRLRVAASRARKDAEGRNQTWRNKADAAEALYSSQCK